MVANSPVRRSLSKECQIVLKVISDGKDIVRVREQPTVACAVVEFGSTTFEGVIWIVAAATLEVRSQMPVSKRLPACRKLLPEQNSAPMKAVVRRPLRP